MSHAPYIMPDGRPLGQFLHDTQVQFISAIEALKTRYSLCSARNGTSRHSTIASCQQFFVTCFNLKDIKIKFSQFSKEPALKPFEAGHEMKDSVTGRAAPGKQQSQAIDTKKS